MGKVQLYRGEEIGQKPVSEYNECYVNDIFQDLRQYGRSAISCFFTNFGSLLILPFVAIILTE